MSRLRRVPWPSTLTDAVLAASRGAGKLGRGRETVLAAAEVTGGGWAAGTRTALYLPVDDGLRRIPWESIERAEWNVDGSVLQVWEAAEFGTPMPMTELRIDNPGRFGQLVRERITASVLVQRHVRLVGAKGVRIVGRRRPADSAGEVTWTFVLDQGLDPAEPELRDRAERTLAAVRDDLGL